jgi:hypothetical protein
MKTKYAVLITAILSSIVTYCFVSFANKSFNPYMFDKGEGNYFAITFVIIIGIIFTMSAFTKDTK